MVSGALALFLMVAGHQYADAYDPDPLIAKAPAHQAQKYMDVSDEDDDVGADLPGLVCPDEKSKAIFQQGATKVFIMAEALQQRGAPQEKISAFVDAQLKHGMEVLHCHL